MNNATAPRNRLASPKAAPEPAVDLNYCVSVSDSPMAGRLHCDTLCRMCERHTTEHLTEVRYGKALPNLTYVCQSCAAKIRETIKASTPPHTPER